MLWGALLLVLVVAGCVRPEAIEADTRTAAILAAQVRREQVVGDITRLSWVLRHSAGNRMENRIALELIIAERRAELDRLNAVIGR